MVINKALLSETSGIIVSELELPDTYSVTVPRQRDNRGSFSKLFNGDKFSYPALIEGVCQINISETYSPGTVRGMHFQHNPCVESKIVFCLSGKVFDVAVDLRKGSKYLGKSASLVLGVDEEQFSGIFIPPGFAHGFQCLTENSVLLYVHSDLYQPESESGVRYDDPYLGIDWPLAVTNISSRDRSFPFLDNHFNGIA